MNIKTITGLALEQGKGWDIEAPAVVRYGQLTGDEFFVSETAARQEVAIINLSQNDPVVMFKHFEPGNPDLKI